MTEHGANREVGRQPYDGRFSGRLSQMRLLFTSDASKSSNILFEGLRKGGGANPVLARRFHAEFLA
jgi:hypothetical protein